MMSPEEIIQIVEAHREGKTIESRYLKVPPHMALGQWAEVLPEELWNFKHCEYRIKPAAPKEWWIPSDPIIGASVFFSPTPIPGWTHVREVLPE